MLRYAVQYKDLDEPLREFIARRGGLNACAERFARWGFFIRTIERCQMVIPTFEHGNSQTSGAEVRPDRR